MRKEAGKGHKFDEAPTSSSASIEMALDSEELLANVGFISPADNIINLFLL